MRIAAKGLFSAMAGRLRSFFFLDHRPGRNVAMEGIRGYAVLLVVIIHTLYCVVHLHLRANCFDTGPYGPIAKQYGRSAALLLCLARSTFAVDLFFLLSAFLITRIVLKNPEQFHYGQYLKKRFWRIYPTFVASIAMGAFLLIYLLGWVPFRWIDVVENLLFLNGAPVYGKNVVPYNAPTWSLFYEFAFYIVFPLGLALWNRARGPAGPGSFLGAAGLIALAVYAHAYMPRSAAFLFGCVIGAHRDDDLKKVARALPTWLVLSVYCAVTLGHCFYSMNENWFIPAFGLAAGMLVVKSCYDEGPLRWFFSTLPMRFLGNISYSLYLVNSTVIALIEVYLQPFGWRLKIWPEALLYCSVALAASVVVASILFALVERRYFVQKPIAKPVEEVPPLRVAA
jgi:peptidoglycan/LPS O-acetylase OafA/YrhL